MKKTERGHIREIWASRRKATKADIEKSQKRCMITGNDFYLDEVKYYKDIQKVNDKHAARYDRKNKNASKRPG